MPSIASTPVIAQFRRSTSASAARYRHAKGSTSSAPSVQRQNASPTGGTAPATVRPTMALLAQNSGGSISSSQT